MSAPSDLHEIGAQVRAFMDERDWAQFHSPRNLAMALSVEASELLELYLWCQDVGPQPLNPAREEQVAQEAADVLITLLNFCDRAGVDLPSAVQHKLEGARRKYPADRVRGRALKYNEYEAYAGED